MFPFDLNEWDCMYIVSTSWQYTVRFERQMDIFTTNLPAILVIMSVLTFKNAIILYILWQSVLFPEETREERKAQIWFKWLSNFFT